MEEKLDNLSPDLSLMNVFVKVEKVTNSNSANSQTQTQSQYTNTTSTQASNVSVEQEANNLFGETTSPEADDPFADLFN